MVIAQNAVIKLLIYDSKDDQSPAELELTGISHVHDLSIYKEYELVTILGVSEDFKEIWFYRINLQGNPYVRSSILDLSEFPDRMKFAINNIDGSIWVASDRPSGLFKIPWESIYRKTETNKIIPIIDLYVDGLPGRNKLSWSIDPAPYPDAYFSILKKDGDLAAFRPVIPADFPVTATEYIDLDVSPGIPYHYKIVYNELAIKAEDEIGPIFALEGNEKTVSVKPLRVLDRIRAGEKSQISLVLRGILLPNRNVEISLSDAPWLEQNYIQISFEPISPPVPGFVSVNIQTELNTPSGVYSIPIEINIDGEMEILWLFAQVWIPYRDSIIEVPSYPGTSRQIGIHTDSQLQSERSNSLLIFKGELEALGECSGNSSVIVRIDQGDGRIIEKRDIIVSGGYYSAGVFLPELKGDTVLRAQITWLGSSTSPGGTSPIINLPVGGYSSLYNKDLESLNEPEAAAFILGQAPQKLEPRPGYEDIHAIMEDAKTTLLSDFSQKTRVELQTLNDVEGSISMNSDKNILLIYALSDTESVNGSIKLNDGTITPDRMAELISGAKSRQNILIVEGPNSGHFADSSLPYPDGTTVITSSSCDEDKICLSPWTDSFSHRFLV